jgi:hypothetical protein
MTPQERAALREAASKATPGPWTSVGDWVMTGSLHVATIPRAFDGDWSRDNAAYIALAHPAAVLALLDECERMRAGGEYARGALRALIPLIEVLPSGDELVATINEAIVLSEFGA